MKEKVESGMGTDPQVTAEMHRIRRTVALVPPGGDREDLISYAKEVVGLRAEIQRQRERHRATWTQLEQVTGLLREAVIDFRTNDLPITANLLEERLNDAISLQAEPAPAQDEQYPPCDFCGVIPDHHPWHGSGLFNGVDSPHIHACNGCRHLLPVNPAQTAPSCNHRFMYFGDQTKRRCADCCVVEGNEQTAPAQDERERVAAALRACDWSGTPIGNKAIVQRACELLTTRPSQTEQQPVAWRIPISGVWQTFATEAEAQAEYDLCHSEDEEYGEHSPAPLYADPIAQTAPKPEQSGLVEAALRKAVAYLDENPFNEIASGSILHRVMGAALSTQGGDA